VDAGLVDEVARVGRESFSRTARQALGVKEMIPVIEGEVDIDTAKAVLVRNTKNFMRRQLSWFQPDERISWVDASELGWEGARERITGMFASGA
jgi:tRNA dimethylallyltransferase